VANFIKSNLIVFIFSQTIDIERKNRLLKVCFVLATGTTFLAFFLAVAINCTNDANKVGGTHR
jgi:hypothetical protein